MADKRKRTLVNKCAYCSKQSDSVRQCSNCTDKTCKHDSFWCSAPGCKTRVCRFCQSRGSLAVTNVSDNIWLCSEHVDLRCGICGKDNKLYECWRCVSRCCRRHSFWCQIPDCGYVLCGKCYANDKHTLTFNRWGWFCNEHENGW